MIEFLQQAEGLLYPHQPKKKRPAISYEMKLGSVKHVVSTDLDAIHTVNDFFAAVRERKNPEILEPKRVKSLIKLQGWATEGHHQIEITTSVDSTPADY